MVANGNFKYIIGAIIVIFGIAAWAATAADTQITVAIMGVAAPMLAALVATLAKLVDISNKQAEMSTKAAEISQKQDDAKVQGEIVRDAVDGKMEKLLQLSATAAKAEGVLEGVLGEKERQEDKKEGDC